MNASAVVCPVCSGSDCRPHARMGAYAYYRCGSCGLLVHDPFPTLETIEAHYAKKFAEGNYKTLLAFSEQYRRVYDDYVIWMRRSRDLAGLRSLDIGCFIGDLVDACRQAGADAYGVELQPEATAIAQQRLPGRVYELNVDETEGPFADHSFDIVTAMAVIEHVQDPARLLRSARRLLKPDGWIFLETPNASSWPARVTKGNWPLLAPVEHLHLFSESAIRRALVAAGFEVVEVRPHIKWLSAAYVFEMMQFYGPQWRSVVGPVFRVLPSAVRRRWLFPFFSGEMLIAARAQG